MMIPKSRPFLFAFLWLFATSAIAFNPPVDEDGPLKVEIKAPDTVKALGEAFDVEVVVSNGGAAAIDGTLEVWVIDDWRVGAENTRKVEQKVTIAPGEPTRVPLKVTAGPATYDAHYPIHARLTAGDRKAHAIKICVVDVPNPASMKKPDRGPAKIQPGLTSLLDLRGQQVYLKTGADGPTRQLGSGWMGSDKETGATFQRATVDRGGRKDSISIHPPWRGGWGTMWADYDLVLPKTKPITLTFANAIRDSNENEPPSDGVEFRVEVQSFALSEAPVQAVFKRFTKAKTWEDASVDLSDHAGTHIRLRLGTGPGPKNSTVCDLGYWGAPTIVAGGHLSPEPVSAEERDRQVADVLRRLDAMTTSAAVRPDESANGTVIDNASYFASLSPGSRGPGEMIIGFASASTRGTRRLLIGGIDVEIDGIPLDSIPFADDGEWKSRFLGLRAIKQATLLCGGRPTTVSMEVRKDAKVLHFRFSMPGVQRDERGHPRFTKIGLGPVLPAGEDDPPKARRVYAGFGNVVENPGRFGLSTDGFRCSTRHVGIDFENGLSLVQATDVFPDRFVVDPGRNVYSLETHHDATISLIPSEKGAFAAAKVYRDGIAKFKPSPGHAKLLGRMCLDYWGTDYQHGIDTVETLAQYGVTDCVYVWHNWQRWGYDYRLPEIYPARGDHALFVKLRETCRKHGVLFSPHDNYIDFYPDAEGYSYKHIIFNEDGTPQKAWFNNGRGAQSYRWLPHAFFPWMKQNVALLNQDVKPDAYFIDVFTAIRPMDYYDIDGQFYPKTRTIEEWGKCFDYVREQFGGAPQISEAGHDTQIGHIAAGEADHMGVVPNQRSGQWGWYIPCDDGERTPWHDAASHGSFILFGGGLANRYVGELDRRTHGYGSDDYMSLTVLGGRNPMAHGDASAETIRTYWLLHDVCAELAKRPLEWHEFGDDNIHRQIVKFGGDGLVHVNRGKDDWKAEGVALQKGNDAAGGTDEAVLPPYGFTAIAGGARADVTKRDGIVTAYAESPTAIFADARPLSIGQADYSASVIAVDGAEGGQYALKIDWEMYHDLPEDTLLFVHFDDPEKQGEAIAFQADGRLDIPMSELCRAGSHSTVTTFRVPENPLKQYNIRFGLFRKSGERSRPLFGADRRGRVRGGTLVVEEGRTATHRPDREASYASGLNTASKVIDFGPVATNGALRILNLHTIIMLPGCPASEIRINTDIFPVPPTEVLYRVSRLDSERRPVGVVAFELKGKHIVFQTSSGDFGYRIVYTRPSR